MKQERTVLKWANGFFSSWSGGVISGIVIMRMWPETVDAIFLLYFLGMLSHYLWYLFSDEMET